MDERWAEASAHVVQDKQVSLKRTPSSTVEVFIHTVTLFQRATWLGLLTKDIISILNHNRYNDIQ